MSADEDWGRIGALMGAERTPVDVPNGDGEPLLHDEDEHGPSSTNESKSVTTAAAQPGAWLQTTTEAVALAQEVDTPEAWRTVADAGRVLSEMAGTLAVFAEGKQMVRWLSQTAEEAARAAQEAERGAALARESLSHLEAAVAAAAETNTASAWKEARRTSMEAPTGGESTADESAQAPALRLKRLQP